MWGLVGVDFATGEDKLWVPGGGGTDDNPFLAATTLGSDGAVITGTDGGMTVFRPQT